MRRAQRFGFAAFALSIVGPATDASAQASPPHREVPELSSAAGRLVVVLTLEGDRSLADHVEDELGASRLLAARQEYQGPLPSRAELEERARSVDAAALVALAHTADGQIELWLIDRVTGKSLVRTLPRERPELLPVRVVELLRASLLELATANLQVGAVAPAPEIRALYNDAVPPPRRRPSVSFALRAGLAGALESSDASAALLAHLGAGGRIGRFGVDASLWLPTFSRAIDRTEGSADVSWGLASATARFYLTEASSRAGVSFGAGGGLEFVTARGRAASPDYRVEVTRGTSPALLADVAATLSVVSWARVYVSVSGAWSLDEVAIVFAPRQVATFGRPIGIGSLGAEVVF